MQPSILQLKKEIEKLEPVPADIHYYNGVDDFKNGFNTLKHMILELIDIQNHDKNTSNDSQRDNGTPEESVRNDRPKGIGGEGESEVEKVCEHCNGTREVSIAQPVYPNEPHVAHTDTAPCPQCTGSDVDDYQEQDDR